MESEGASKNMLPSKLKTTILSLHILAMVVYVPAVIWPWLSGGDYTTPPDYVNPKYNSQYAAGFWMLPNCDRCQFGWRGVLTVGLAYSWWYLSSRIMMSIVTFCMFLTSGVLIYWFYWTNEREALLKRVTLSALLVSFCGMAAVIPVYIHYMDIYFTYMDWNYAAIIITSTSGVICLLNALLTSRVETTSSIKYKHLAQDHIYIITTDEK